MFWGTIIYCSLGLWLKPACVRPPCVRALDCSNHSALWARVMPVFFVVKSQGKGMEDDASRTLFREVTLKKKYLIKKKRKKKKVAQWLRQVVRSIGGLTFYVSIWGTTLFLLLLWLVTDQISQRADSAFLTSFLPSSDCFQQSLTVDTLKMEFSDKNVRNLGFIFNSNRTIKQHVIKVCLTAYYDLHASVPSATTSEKMQVKSWLLLVYCLD